MRAGGGGGGKDMQTCSGGRGNEAAGKGGGVRRGCNPDHAGAPGLCSPFLRPSPLEPRSLPHPRRHSVWGVWTPLPRPREPRLHHGASRGLGKLRKRFEDWEL